MRVFLDANILFSAGDPASATRMLLDTARARAELLTSPHAWEEARRNVALKRPRYLPGLESLQPVLRMTHAFRLPIAVVLPAKDMPILGAAIGAGCTHLWTSDERHFGPHYGKLIEGVRVLSSTMLADELGL